MSKIRSYCLLGAAALALTMGSATMASAHEWEHGCKTWNGPQDGAPVGDTDESAMPGIEINPDDVNGPPPVHDEDGMGYMNHGMNHGDMNAPSSRAIIAADMRMHHDMMVPFCGNPDQDFLAHMIPHHQGAVDLAEIELKYGTDPHVRELAKSIIASERAEIDLMSTMLNKDGGVRHPPHHHHHHHDDKAGAKAATPAKPALPAAPVKPTQGQ